MKEKLLFILLNFTLCYGFSQSREIDSIKLYLTNIKEHDTIKIKTYLDLAGKYGIHSMDSLKKYTLTAIDLSRKNNDYLLDGGYYFMGLYYRSIGEINKAKESYQKAIPLVDSITKQQKLAQILSAYADLLSETNELDEKIAYYTRALKLKEDIGDKYRIAITQYNFSNVYTNVGFDTLAIDYLKRALINAEISDKKTLKKPLKGQILNNLTIFALKNNSLDEANTYLKESEKICKETASNRLCFNTFIQKGRYLDKSKKTDEAEIAFLTSLEYAKKRKVPLDIMLVYAYLGKHYEFSGNPKKAIQNFKKAQEQDTANSERIMSPFAYESWSRAESKLGNYKKSNEYLLKYLKIKDSLNSEKNKRSLANAEAKYETEKKDKEIANQQLALKSKEAEIEKRKSQNTIMSGLTLFLLLTTLLAWFLYQQRQKRKDQEIVSLKREQQVKTLELLMEGEEKERLRIAQELHDGVNVDLSAIKYKLTSLLEKNNKVINEAVVMIDKSCEQVRAISHNLVPPALKNFSLVEAIEDYCSTTNAIHDKQVNFQHIGNSISISKKVEVNIFRIVQELVNNSVKHAEASEVDVQISHQNNVIQLTIEDNGKGFDTNQDMNNGIGLQNVKSRIKYLNAKLDVTSDAKGTSYVIDINTKDIT